MELSGSGSDQPRCPSSDSCMHAAFDLVFTLNRTGRVSAASGETEKWSGVATAS